MSYGTDTWCTDALVTSRRASGVEVVAQAIYRRLITPRGTLRGGDEESAYGLDISAYVGAVGYPTALAALPSLVRGEILKDDRVSEVIVKATIAKGTDGAIAITLDLTVLLGEEDESFPLTLSVNDTSVEVIGGAS